MKLIIVHSHYRPGGVRRVIELATPHLVRRLRPRVKQVVLAGADQPEESWLKAFTASLRPVPVICESDRSLGYLSEQQPANARTISARLRTFLSRLVRNGISGDSLVWAHNHGLGRNLLLTRELQRVCEPRETPLVFHHHDWWFDNRWQRWPEMRRHEFRSLADVAATVFPAAANVRHVAINQSDATILKKYFPGQTGWLPNPASDSAAPSKEGTPRARRWLAGQLGYDAPFWLMPCRLLRRKNIGEALLLTRWLREDAWLVTTADVTSPEEQPYADRLRAAARKFRWPLRLSILRDCPGGPPIPDLLGASEVLLLTSLQEGFGLSYIEAAIAQRALITRNLPNIGPDLADWGLHFPQSYDELLVHPGLFDLRGEIARQKRLFREWRDKLPIALRRHAGEPILLGGGSCDDGVPFSRLTLTAQLEVLAHPPGLSWLPCVALNPWLESWRQAAAKGRLAATPWPRTAERSLSGASFAGGFQQILNQLPESCISARTSTAAQREFIHDKLQGPNLYPLTWAPET